MRKLFLILICTTIGCKAQNVKVIELSKKSEINYIFSRISPSPDLVIHKELYGGGIYATIYYMLDPRATPENFSVETEEFLSSYIISVIPDGDYYSWSRLYKIEGLANPKILEIKETEYPKFSLRIKHGIFNDTKIELFEFEINE